jgi:abortive infection bacteriophage resistance protein
MAEYLKPPLTIEHQIDFLKTKDLKIEDETRAASYLSNINFYRLKAYMIPFQYDDGSNKKFKSEVTFDNILNLYIFDRRLRLLVFDAIEKIEVAFRTQIIYHYSINYSSVWYENGNLYKQEEYFSKNLKKIDDEIRRSSEEFIKHYNAKYQSPSRPPAWMSFEVISMGLLSKIFANLKNDNSKKEIINYFHLPNADVLESWMHSITYVRNICAHHSRLWNRVITLKPTLLKNSKKQWLNNKTIPNNRLYAFLCCLIYLLKTITPNTNFADHFKDLHETYPGINLKRMGFPENWQEEPLWQ